ncbi:MAG: cell division protein ZipA [Legionella sp.]|nr:cell division protein ZipA [Legionella sp.]
MQANWSLILNVLLLLGVMVTIGLLMKSRRRQSVSQLPRKPTLGPVEALKPEATIFNDDIIAVRKIQQTTDFDKRAPHLSPVKSAPSPQIGSQVVAKPIIEPQESHKSKSSSLMMFLLAKENRQFAGYELLQTVLACGLRFGEEYLFHRHQLANGQGPVLFSLAAATPTGIFDLQNIGAFSVRGLCLFMKPSDNPGIDSERFSIMLDTARQLSEGLDGLLLDDKQKPLTTERIDRYMKDLQILDYEPQLI